MTDQFMISGGKVKYSSLTVSQVAYAGSEPSQVFPHCNHILVACGQLLMSALIGQ
jgi:hypothetical protein